MERVALVGLLIGLLPSAALPQRVEVAAWGGAHRATPTAPVGLICDDCNEPSVRRGLGILVGGRLGFRVSTHFGIDVTLQRARADNHVESPSGRFSRDSGLETVTATFVALQLNARVRVGELPEIALAAGPARSMVSVASSTPGVVPVTRSGRRNAVACSVAIRPRLSTRWSAEIRGDAYLHSASPTSVTETARDLSVAAGVTWALRP